MIVTLEDAVLYVRQFYYRMEGKPEDAKEILKLAEQFYYRMEGQARAGT